MITITKPDKGEEQKLMDDLRKTIEKFYSGDVSPTEFCFQDMDIEKIIRLKDTDYNAIITLFEEWNKKNVSIANIICNLLNIKQ